MIAQQPRKSCLVRLWRKDPCPYLEGSLNSVLAQQSVMCGEDRELQAPGNPELVEDIRKVMLHSLLAEGQLFRNALVAAADCDSRDNLQLTGRNSEVVGIEL